MDELAVVALCRFSVVILGSKTRLENLVWSVSTLSVRGGLLRFGLTIYCNAKCGPPKT